MPAMIVEKLSKEFAYDEKEAGIRHSIRSLWFREKLIRKPDRAVEKGS